MGYQNIVEIKSLFALDEYDVEALEAFPINAHMILKSFPTKLELSTQYINPQQFFDTFKEKSVYSFAAGITLIRVVDSNTLLALLGTMVIRPAHWFTTKILPSVVDEREERRKQRKAASIENDRLRRERREKLYAVLNTMPYEEKYAIIASGVKKGMDELRNRLCEMRFAKNMTYEEIGKALSISRPRAQGICIRFEQILRGHVSEKLAITQ